MIKPESMLYDIGYTYIVVRSEFYQAYLMN